MAAGNGWAQTNTQFRNGQQCTGEHRIGHFLIGFGLALLLVLHQWIAGPSLVMAAEDLRPLFYEANQYYEAGDFTRAIETYNQILERGQASGNLYYNLGNAYYRAGQKGQALVNYLRARQWIPRDPDLHANLEHVQAELGLPEESQGLIALLAAGVGNMVNRREMAWLDSILITGGTVLILLRFFRPRWKQQLQIPLIVVAVLLGAALVGSGFSLMDGSQNLAIVVAKEVTTRFEPSESGGAHFTLKEGNQVILDTTREGWVLLQRTDGKKGWVKAEAVEALQLTRSR